MRDFETDLTLERLKSVLSYDMETGEFQWLVRKNRAAQGSVAGSMATKGYLRIKIDGFSYFAHRLAVFYVTGKWPPDEVDHRDLIKTNNRWENLRLSTSSENKRNVRARNPVSGFKGVALMPWGKYQVKIRVAGHGQKTVGYFDTAEQASRAYLEAAESLCGEFARAA